MAERLQRYLARAGVASRRHAETLITAGRVTVNNQPATTLGTKVEPNDLVALDGKLVMPPDAVSWYVLYKPVGVVTTLEDPQGRPTVRGLLGAIPTRVFPLGRLDWDAEGALLLTDDGAAAHRLLHPSFQVPRTYLAKVKGTPTEESLARLLTGVRLEDGPAKVLEVQRFQAAERNTWLKLTVGEGRPHLVKRLCAAIGYPVVRLFRPHQAGISVAGMQPGEIRPLRPEELALLTAVANGQPVPPMTLTLPARRHGRADEEEETEAAPRPPKPPRFGTRAWRAAGGGAQTRTPSFGGSEAQRGRGARPSGRPPEGRSASPRTSMGRPRGRDFETGRQPNRSPGTRPPRRGEGTEGEGPRAFGTEHPKRFPLDGRPRTGRSGPRRGDFHAAASGRPSHGQKPGDGQAGWQSSPSGGRAGASRRSGRPEGAPFRQGRGKPPDAARGWAPKPPGGRRPSFGPGTRTPGERFSPRPAGGGRFRGKPAGSRSGAARPAGGRGLERTRPPGAGGPPRSGPRPERASRGGGPGHGWGPRPPAAGGPPHGRGRTFPGRGGGSGRPGGRRGPPGHRGGAPRGPKR